MVNVCCVDSCTNRYRSKRDRKCSLFKFPKCKDLREEWIQIISKVNGKITKPTRICDRHFDPEFLIRSYSWWDHLNLDKVSTYGLNLNNDLTDGKVCILIIVILIKFKHLLNDTYYMKSIEVLQRIRPILRPNAIPSVFKYVSENDTDVAGHNQCKDVYKNLSQVLWRNHLYKVVLYF